MKRTETADTHGSTRRAIVLLAVAGAMLAIAFVPWSGARADQAEVSALVDTLAREFATVMYDERLDPPQRIARLESVFEDAFDVDRISRMVLAANETQPTAAQMTEFRKLFSRYVAVISAAWLSSLSERPLVVTGHRQHSDEQSFVTAEIRRPAPDQPLRLGFRIRKTPDGLRIYDVLVEGISLVLTKRDEIRSLVQREGIDRMLARLREVTQVADRRVSARAAAR